LNIPCGFSAVNGYNFLLYSTDKRKLRAYNKMDCRTESERFFNPALAAGPKSPQV
jgi:hypothetical protein